MVAHFYYYYYYYYYSWIQIVGPPGPLIALGFFVIVFVFDSDVAPEVVQVVLKCVYIFALHDGGVQFIPHLCRPLVEWFVVDPAYPIFRSEFLQLEIVIQACRSSRLWSEWGRYRLFVVFREVLIQLDHVTALSSVRKRWEVKSSQSLRLFQVSKPVH